MPSKPKDARLSQQFWLDGHSWHYTSIWNFMGKKVQVEIERNFYDFQSHRRVEIFDPKAKKWNFLCSLPFNNAHCLPASTSRKEEDIRPFEADEADLLKEAALVLG